MPSKINYLIKQEKEWQPRIHYIDFQYIDQRNTNRTEINSQKLYAGAKEHMVSLSANCRTKKKEDPVMLLSRGETTAIPILLDHYIWWLSINLTLPTVF